MAQATDAVWLPVLPDMSGFGKGIVAGAGKGVDASGKAVGGRFGTAMLAGAAVVAGGAALAAKALYGIGETFDEVSDTIRAGTGATGADLQDLIDSAKNVGRTVPAEFETIGTTVADINTRLGLTGETLETFAAQALEAGRIMGEEIDINAVSSAFNVFQIQGEDTTDAMDHLFRVSQATGIGINELANNVSANAPAVQALGFSFEESAALVGNLDKAGLNSSKMMAGMGRALVELAKDGEEPQEAFRRVTGEVQELLDKGDKAAAVDLAASLFGTRNASQFIGALETGALAMDDLASVAGMTDDTIIGAGEETMDFAEKWQMFKNDIMTRIEPAATKLFNAIGDGMDWITGTGVPALERMAGWLKENQAWLVPIAAGVGAIAGALAVLVGAIKTWQLVTRAMAAAQAALNIVMLANPIGLIVILLVGLVAAFVVAWKNSETFRKIVTGAWEGIKAAASAVWDWLKKAFQWIKDGLSSVGKWFKDRGRDIANAWQAMRDAISAGWDWIKSKVFDAFKAGIDIVTSWFTDKVNTIVTIWDGLKTAFKAVWDWIDQNVFQNFMRGLDIVVGYVRGGIGMIGDLWDGLKSLFMAPINWVIREVWNGGIVRVFNAVADIIPGVSRMSEQREIGAPRSGAGRSRGGRTQLEARAMGGPVRAGQPYLVGEEGPEIIWPDRAGFVSTAAQSRQVQSAWSQANPPHGGVGGWFSDRWDNVKSGAQWVADGVKDAAGNVVKWARGGLAKAAGLVLNPIKGLIGSALGGAGRFGEVAGGMATTAIDRVLEWVAGHDEGAAPDAGGRSLRGALPYVNNAAHALSDAVGGVRTMQAFNQSMAGGHPAGKAVDFIDSVSKLNRLADVIAGGGHFDNFNYMAWQGRLWSPGRGWRAQGRGFGNDPYHNWHLHAEWYDRGGMLKPGMGLYANATGGPEPVLTGQQWRDVSTLAARGAGVGMPGTVVLVDRDGTFISRMHVEADGRISEAQRRQKASLS